MASLSPQSIKDATCSDQKSKIPPLYSAEFAKLKTFILPKTVQNNTESQFVADNMIHEWRTTGIFQIKIDASQKATLASCFKQSKAFFQCPFKQKSRYVNDQSFAGYVASGEEITDQVADNSEIFTITKDLQLSDSRVQDRWPCHGPTPWPHEEYKSKMNDLMQLLGEFGDKILKLTALGLGLDRVDTLLDITEDGWHHMRVLRFPQYDKVGEKGTQGRGIGPHTDYGLLVIAAQDDVGGLFVRPRPEEHCVKNLQYSMAGQNEKDSTWLFVPPVENTLTVFPGDMMQLLTNDFLPSTPHKVGLNRSERYAFAYFHEPNFSAVIETLPKFREKIHYGTHFTNMSLQNYPLRVTTTRIQQEGRMEILKKIRSEVTNREI